MEKTIPPCLLAFVGEEEEEIIHKTKKLGMERP
jgi:hypothetical protein